jgi:hypothetical protein
MSYDMIKTGLGGFPTKAGTPTLTPTVPPVYHSTSPTQNPPRISDVTDQSEERIVVSVQTVPYDRHSDGGISSDELLSPGDILFTIRSNANDVRVPVMELSFVNIFLANRWQEFRNLFSMRVIALYQEVMRKMSDNPPIQLKEVDQLLPDRQMTLESLCQIASLSDYVDATNCLPFKLNGAHRNAYVPSEDELYMSIKSSEHFTREVVGPQYAVDEQGVPASYKPSKFDDLKVSKGFKLTSASKDILYEMELKQKYRMIIKFILAGFPEISTFVTLEGIKEKFSYMGVYVSSQDEETPESILSKGHARNINFSVRGPTEVTNRWGSSMITNSCLFLVLKRLRHTDGTFGEFYFAPYNSSDNSSQNHKPYPFGSTKAPEGPKFENNTRRRVVPTHETSYMDISGVLHVGHVFYVGRIKDQFKEVEPFQAKLTSLGLKRNVANLDYSAYDMLAPNTYQAAYESKLQLRKILVYLGI